MWLFYQSRSLFRPFVIWTSFGAVAFWGHSTHWTFVHNAHSASQEHSAANHVNQELHLVSLASKRREGLIEWNSLEELEKSGVELGRAEKKSIEENISAMATVAYNGQRLAQLSSRTPGHVWQVYVRPGQSIKRGDVLAIVDSQVVGEAKSDWMQKRFAAIHLRRIYERLKRVTQGALPEQRVLSAESELRKADLECYMAQQRLSNLGLILPNFDNIDLTLDELSERIRYLGIPEPLLDAHGPRPTTANLISIASPFDGTVVEQKGVVGEVVNSEQVMFVVADTRTMWLKLSIRREDATRIALGQKFSFTAIGMKHPISTKIAWISSGIDPETRTVQAGCEVENMHIEAVSTSETDLPLRANQFGNARIIVAEHPQATIIPESALQKMPDLREIVFVKVGTPAVFEPRVVKSGVRNRGTVQILEGVDADDEIVTKGSFILKSEMMRSSLVGG
jgi:cobalt-zinc-cadmium efflux system membrane fusion protein